MNSIPTTALLIASAIPSGLAYAAMLGLGLHRHGSPLAVSLASTVLVFGPALVAGAVSAADRSRTFAWVNLSWPLVLLLALPVYFPGERRDAVVSGIGLVAPESASRWIASGLPEEPEVSRPEVPLAESVVATVDRPVTRALEEHEIALPVEGEGRKLSVPVVFEHGDRTVEVWMMLDTGATYTTLPISVLDQLGAVPGSDDPIVRLHTANGERQAQLALLDRVWLGNLPLDGVAVATCDLCATGDNVGLLGLNVTGAYNLQLNTDAAEAVFSARSERNRRLDVAPFSDMEARFARYPGGRVEVEVDFENLASRPISKAAALVQCGSAMWTVTHEQVQPGERVQAQRRLPAHEACESYQVSLFSAAW